MPWLNSQTFLGNHQPKDFISTLNDIPLHYHHLDSSQFMFSFPQFFIFFFLFLYPWFNSYHRRCYTTIIHPSVCALNACWPFLLPIKLSPQFRLANFAAFVISLFCKVSAIFPTTVAFWLLFAFGGWFFKVTANFSVALLWIWARSSKSLFIIVAFTADLGINITVSFSFICAIYCCFTLYYKSTWNWKLSIKNIFSASWKLI